jgi:hypothetical protein
MYHTVLPRLVPRYRGSVTVPSACSTADGTKSRAPSAAAGPAPAATLPVSLLAIRQFLEDPLQGSARFRLRLREIEGDDEIADREDEAF